MATVTIGRAQRVVVADMAGRAWGRRRRHVRAGQSKSCGAVIECRSQKGHRGVAGGAIGHSECRSG
jgi:hypothetical protein